MKKKDIPIGTKFSLRCGETVEVVDFNYCSDIKVVTESGEIISTNSTQLYSGKIKGYKNKITLNRYAEITVGYEYSISGINYKVIECLNYSSVVVQREDGGVFTSTKARVQAGKATGKSSGLIATDKYLVPGNRWIGGFEGQYSVSPEGDIYSYKTLPPVKMKATAPFNHARQSYMYPLVNLSSNGVFMTKTIHRLVAEAFIQKEEGKEYVNHIDGDKSNNRVENLEWCTASENTKHAIESGLSTKERPIGTKYDEKIIESMNRGYHLLDKSKLDRLRKDNSVLDRLGIDPTLFFSLPNTRGKMKASRIPVDLIVRLAETMTLTEIANMYGYSLSAISRKLKKADIRL